MSAPQKKREPTPFVPYVTEKPSRRMLFEDFHCERRELDLQLHECMTDYVNANALRTQTSPCFKCKIGLENRTRFAKRG